MTTIEPGLTIAGGAVAVNLVLAMIKIATGVIGNSYALIADGIESTADIFSSLIVWGGLQWSSKPPDEDHPYGHGKAESLAGMVVALFLIAAAIFISIQSVQEIRSPHGAPAWYTLVVLGVIIVVKEALYRRMFRIGAQLGSSALRSDAWHHRSDAITSLAAFVGIGLALIGGEGYEAADDWAALAASSIIFINGIRLLRPALNEVMDANVPGAVEQQIIALAAQVDGVIAIEKCRVRKSGLGYLMDIHVEVDAELTIRAAHLIGHHVKDRLIGSDLPIVDVVVHVEPASADGSVDPR